VTYLLTRLFAAAMYWVGARRHPTQLAALFTFLPLSLLAPLVVVAGAFLEGGGGLEPGWAPSSSTWPVRLEPAVEPGR
jgi:hypothetical protein